MANPRHRHHQLAIAQALRRPPADETQGMEIQYAPEKIPEQGPDPLSPEELRQFFAERMPAEARAAQPESHVGLLEMLDDLIGGNEAEAAPKPRHTMPSNYIGPG